MIRDFLKKNITSQAGYVEYGYGQVEPNHLSGKRTGQIYAQLPADKEIEVLEQGQFVKYDYAKGVCDFTGEGEWMLVFNEIKNYREDQLDCEFAMIKDNYQARIYSPLDHETLKFIKSRYYNGVDAEGKDSIIIGEKTYKFDDVTAAPDMYEPAYNEDPFTVEGTYKEKRMPEGTTMVPRVLKTNPGDIMTTNFIVEEELAVNDILKINNKGILSKAGTDESMQWQVVKVYTMPDGQKGVKVMRIV